MATAKPKDNSAEYVQLKKAKALPFSAPEQKLRDALTAGYKDVSAQGSESYHPAASDRHVAQVYFKRRTLAVISIFVRGDTYRSYLLSQIRSPPQARLLLGYAAVLS